MSKKEEIKNAGRKRKKKVHEALFPITEHSAENRTSNALEQSEETDTKYNEKNNKKDTLYTGGGHSMEHNTEHRADYSPDNNLSDTKFDYIPDTTADKTADKVKALEKRLKERNKKKKKETFDEKYKKVTLYLEKDIHKILYLDGEGTNGGVTAVLNQILKNYYGLK